MIDGTEAMIGLQEDVQREKRRGDYLAVRCSHLESELVSLRSAIRSARNIAIGVMPDDEARKAIVAALGTYTMAASHVEHLERAA